MTKEEVVEKCNEIFGKLEEFSNNISMLADDIRDIYRMAEYLPAEVTDIENSPVLTEQE